MACTPWPTVSVRSTKSNRSLFWILCTMCDEVAQLSTSLLPGTERKDDVHTAVQTIAKRVIQNLLVDERDVPSSNQFDLLAPDQLLLLCAEAQRLLEKEVRNGSFSADPHCLRVGCHGHRPSPCQSVRRYPRAVVRPTWYVIERIRECHS